MSMAFLVSALGVGLLQGFVHCAGMCGPFVMAYSLSLGPHAGATPSQGNGRGTFRRALLHAHLPHNLGRIFSFTLLGVIFGTVGSFVDAAVQTAGVQAVAAFAGGAIMIAWAVDELRTGRGAGFLERWSPLGWSPLQDRLRRAMNRQDPLGAFLAGLILGLHPCGLLFAMLISASASGSAIQGGLTMLAFGIGTVPSLLTVAAAGFYGRRRLQGRGFSNVAAALIALGGILFILRGMVINHWIPSVNPWLF
ncbi:MAG: sulfite exporter TauE/SafE family protein [Bacilli bacterium]